MNKKTNTVFSKFFDLVAKVDKQKYMDFMGKYYFYNEEI